MNTITNAAARGVSRRGLVAGAAAAGMVAGATAMLAGAAAGATRAQAQTPAPEDIAWDREADVVVIGYGGAGAAAAITAHDAGAEVLVLEKMAQGGGNTALNSSASGGVLHSTDADATYAYISQLFERSHAEMDESLVRTFSDRCGECVDWLCGLKPGTEMVSYGGACFGALEGADSVQKYGVTIEGAASSTAHTGVSLFEVYAYAVEERGIEVLCSTPAQRLVVNATGEVIGCVATTADGDEINVKARKAVILTCGGYEYDQTMLQNYLFADAASIHPAGCAGNTGDGIRMALAVGADLWHMTAYNCPLGFYAEGLETPSLFGALQPSMIWVNKLGKRFANERGVESHTALYAVSHYDSRTLDFNELPSWRIYDEAARTSGKVVGGAIWSDDNLEEVGKGWVMQAETIAELAEKIDVDPDALVATVERWNADVEAGEDTQFGRAIEPAEKGGAAPSAPLSTPPFYAVAQYPALLNTQGGPRRNAEAQVVDAFGEPIGRLYSAGELGSLWGPVHQGAGNNAEGLIFGRIAGENAAALPSWDA